MNYKFPFYCAILMSVVAVLLLIALIDEESQWEKAIGNNRESIESIKKDCEKSLPRTDECVMVFDFVPVKKEK